jgi:hypothetical protein
VIANAEFDKSHDFTIRDSQSLFTPIKLANAGETMNGDSWREEARRGHRHEAVKSQVEGEVQAEISDRAVAARPARRRIEHVGDFRSKLLRGR